MSALNPQATLVAKDPVFAVLPFRAVVAQLFEPVGLEAGGDGKFRQPALHGHVNAVGGGIADDEAGLSTTTHDPAEQSPNLE